VIYVKLARYVKLCVYKHDRTQSGVATSRLTLHWMCELPRTGYHVCVKNNTYMYVAWTSNNRVLWMEWSWWVTSNDACEASEQLIVLANGDDKSDLYCCLLPQCETLRTCRSGFPTATMAQSDNAFRQVMSILLHEAKPVLRLFCLHLNTIDWSGHVTSTIRRHKWLGFMIRV